MKLFIPFALLLFQLNLVRQENFSPAIRPESTIKTITERITDTHTRLSILGLSELKSGDLLVTKVYLDQNNLRSIVEEFLNTDYMGMKIFKYRKSPQH